MAVFSVDVPREKDAHMRLFNVAAPLSLFLLAACDSTSFEAPRIDLRPTAPKEYRLDLDSGIVVTFDK